MTTPPTERSSKGLWRIGVGAGLGLVGAICEIVLPLTFLLILLDHPDGFVPLGAGLLDAIGVLVLAGSLLSLLSLFLYRRSFLGLRRADARFTSAAVLCLVGSLGFLVLLVADLIVLANSAALLDCVHGNPEDVLTCLRSTAPVGWATSEIGFALSWVGGVGIVLGLRLAGNRYRSRILVGAAAVYLLLLIFLIVPVWALLTPPPQLELLLPEAPGLSVAAPLLALWGSARARRALDRG